MTMEPERRGENITALTSPRQRAGLEASPSSSQRLWASPSMLRSGASMAAQVELFLKRWLSKEGSRAYLGQPHWRGFLVLRAQRWFRSWLESINSNLEPTCHPHEPISSAG